MKLIDIIFENRTDANVKFHTYDCDFIVKLVKKYNKSDIYDRIRGLQNVLTVQAIENKKLSSMNKGSDYEYAMINVKFVTDKEPKEQMDDLVKLMVKHDEANPNIVGLVAAKYNDKTLVKSK